MSLKNAWYIITTIQYKIHRDTLDVYFGGKSVEIEGEGREMRQ